MTVDARIKTSFRAHPKRVKLQRRLGPAGPLALIDLILYTAENRQSGSYGSMTAEDLAVAAQWPGDPEQFVTALREVGFLDVSEHGELSLHGWDQSNPYAANYGERQLIARINSHVGWLKRKGIACSKRACELCREHATRMRPAQKGNAPPPSHHSPSPLTTHTVKKRKPASRLSDDWTPKETTAAWAAKNFPTVNFTREVEAFRDWHLGKGTLWVDWDRALMSWIRRSEKDYAKGSTHGRTDNRKPDTKPAEPRTANKFKQLSGAEILAKRGVHQVQLETPGDPSSDLR